MSHSSSSEDMRKSYDAYCALMGYDENCAAYISRYAAQQEPQAPAVRAGSMSLGAAIEKGLKEEAHSITRELVKSRAPLDIIQEELLKYLRSSGFDVTQATVSRDIKELGLIKILSAETGKYKYSLVDSGEQAVSNKYISIFKEAVISIKIAQNLVVLKTIRAMANSICGLIDKLNLDSVLGAVAGDDTVMVILPTNDQAVKVATTIEALINV